MFKNVLGRVEKDKLWSDVVTRDKSVYHYPINFQILEMNVWRLIYN